MTGTRGISARDARRVLDAALARAEELGIGACVAVVDHGGNPLGLIRMDGASFLTAPLATGKAVTAAGLGLPTQDFAIMAEGDPALLAGMAGQPNVTIIAGGVPIMIDGAVAGAVGASGGSAEADHSIAQTGAAALAAAPVAGS